MPDWAAALSPREFVEAIATAAAVAEADVQYGLTCLFARSGKAAFLERLLLSSGGAGADGEGGGEDEAALGDPTMLPELYALLELFARRRAAMPVVEKNMRMWIHRRRFLTLRAARAEAARRARGTARRARIGGRVIRLGWPASPPFWGSAHPLSLVMP